MNQKGEIITIAIVATFIILSIATIATSVVIQNPKQSLTTSTRAADICQGDVKGHYCEYTSNNFGVPPYCVVVKNNNGNDCYERADNIPGCCTAPTNPPVDNSGACYKGKFCGIDACNGTVTLPNGKKGDPLHCSACNGGWCNGGTCATCGNQAPQPTVPPQNPPPGGTSGAQCTGTVYQPPSGGQQPNCSQFNGRVKIDNNVWTTNCSKSCSSDGECAANGAPGWCYGFGDGKKCMSLAGSANGCQVQQVSVSAPPPASGGPGGTSGNPPPSTGSNPPPASGGQPQPTQVKTNSPTPISANNACGATYPYSTSSQCRADCSSAGELCEKQSGRSCYRCVFNGTTKPTSTPVPTTTSIPTPTAAPVTGAACNKIFVAVFRKEGEGNVLVTLNHPLYITTNYNGVGYRAVVNSSRAEEMTGSQPLSIPADAYNNLSFAMNLDLNAQEYEDAGGMVRGSDGKGTCTATFFIRKKQAAQPPPTPQEVCTKQACAFDYGVELAKVCTGSSCRIYSACTGDRQDLTGNNRGTDPSALWCQAQNRPMKLTAFFNFKRIHLDEEYHKTRPIRVLFNFSPSLYRPNQFISEVPIPLDKFKSMQRTPDYHNGKGFGYSGSLSAYTTLLINRKDNDVPVQVFLRYKMPQESGEREVAWYRTAISWQQDSTNMVIEVNDGP